MKKLLLATMLGASLAANAATAEIDFSYASDDIGFYTIGASAPLTYDVAIFLPGSEFAGGKIKAINVPMNTAAGVSNYKSSSVWLSSQLGSNPDIASYSTNITSDGSYGNLGLTLPEEYTITEQGVYVGYSFTVLAGDGGTQYPLALSSGNNLNALFLQVNSTGWTNMNPKNGLSSALTVKIETSSLPDANVSVVSVPDLAMAKIGEPHTFPVVLNSTAGVAVNSVDLEFTFNGNTTSSHYDLPSPVAPTFGTEFKALAEIPAIDEFVKNGTATVKVVKVNGVDNESTGNVSNVTIAVVSEVPVRRTLFEECTCTKCPYCTRGFAALEYVKANYPDDFILASYHNTWQGSDPMNMGNPPFNASANPSAAINRALQGIDPYYGTQTYNYDVPVVGDLLGQNEIASPWAISVDYVWTDDNNLTANVSAKNVLGYENERYKIGYILVCDGLSGKTSSWRQSNAYYSDDPVYVQELNDFCKGGKYGKSTIIGLVFNDVVISTDGNKGVDDSVPTTLAADEEVAHSFTWDISKISSTLIPDRNNLRVIAFVLNRKGEVENAAQHDVAYSSDSVEGIETADADAPVEYYNLSGVKVDNPQGGIFIRRQGSRTSKVILK